jgi:hypothetical protein
MTGADSAGQPGTAAANPLDDDRDRSSLSWQRTMAQSALVVLFAAVTSIRVGEPVVTIGAAALALVAFGIAAFAPSAGSRKSAWPLMRTAATVTVVAGLLGAAIPIALIVTA